MGSNNRLISSSHAGLGMSEKNCKHHIKIMIGPSSHLKANSMGLLGAPEFFSFDLIL